MYARWFFSQPPSGLWKPSTLAGLPPASRSFGECITFLYEAPYQRSKFAYFIFCLRPLIEGFVYCLKRLFTPPSPIFRLFRNCCLSLPLDIVPRDAQAVLRRLSYDLRRHAVRDVLHFSQTGRSQLTWLTIYVLVICPLTTPFFVVACSF